MALSDSIGSELVPVPADTTRSSFTTLALKIREAGLLDRRPGYYSLKIGLTLAAFFAAWVAFVLVGNSWATLAVAVLLGALFTQLGFLGHDAGHQQVFGSRRANRLLGLTVGNVMIGLNFGWWVPKHSAHHSHPNEIGLDPDIGDGILVAPPTVRSHRPRDVIARWMVRWQAPLFFPLMLLRSTGLHVLGIQQLARKRNRAAVSEGLLIVLHAALYLSLVLWVLSPLKALVFILIQQAVFSLYLGCSFAPNHKGMPIIEDAASMSFAQRQVSTARNIEGGRFTDLLLGGLNYQVEHHLFPSMPRPNLKRAQRIVKPFCAEESLGYCEDSLFGSFRQIIRHLDAMAVSASVQPSAVGP